MENNLEVGFKAVNIASYLLFGKIFTFALLGISLILVTRLLGPAQYGIYTLAIAFLGIFGGVGYLGVGTALQKFISQYKQIEDKEVISNIISSGLLVVMASGIILVAAFLGLSGLISQYVFHNGNMGYIIAALATLIIIQLLFGTFYDAIIGLGNGKRVAVVVIIEAFFQSVISIVLAIEGFGALAPIYGLIVGNLLGFFVGLWYVLGPFGFYLCVPSAKYIKKIFVFSIPIALSGIFGDFTGSFGIIFLGYFVGIGVIGNLGIATRTGTLMGVIFDSISLAILPTFSAALANEKTSKEIGKIYQYTVYFALLIVSPLLFYMMAFSTPFSLTIFGGGYQSAPLYISILSFGMLIGIAGTYASTLLISAGKVKTVLAYNVVMDIAMFALFFLLVPSLGGIGYALVSFVLVPLIGNILFIGKLHGLYKVKLEFRKLIRLGLANLVVLFLAIVLSMFIGGILLLVSGGIMFALAYPILAVLLGGAGKEEINTVKTLSKSIPFVGMFLRILADYAGLVAR